MLYDEIAHVCMAHIPPFEWTSRRGDATRCPRCHPGERRLATQPETATHV
ncbi:MAG: hypothetical protein ACRDQB_03385 [Thermocrispum sp.]